MRMFDEPKAAAVKVPIPCPDTAVSAPGVSVQHLAPYSDWATPFARLPHCWFQLLITVIEGICNSGRITVLVGLSHECTLTS